MGLRNAEDRGGAPAGNLKHWWNGGTLRVGMSSNRGHLLFPEMFPEMLLCGTGISVYGVVNVPEFLGKLAKLNSKAMVALRELEHRWSRIQVVPLAASHTFQPCFWTATHT